MNQTQPDEIDDVLYDWYKWSGSYEPHLGYGGADSTCRDFRISRQWMGYDDLSAQVDYQLIKAVGEAGLARSERANGLRRIT